MTNGAGSHLYNSHKKASRSMKHALRVDMIDPTRGMIEASKDEFFISAEHMTVEQCRSELSSLSHEQSRLSNELVIAKKTENAADISHIGQKMQTLANRRSPIKKRLAALMRDHDADILSQVIKDLLPEETAKAVFDEFSNRCRLRG